MSSHTPGPWLLSEKDNAFVYALNDSGTNRFYFKVYGGHISHQKRRYVSGNPKTSEEEVLANARLISAAPDLLSALREVVAISDRDHEAWGRAKAAIAKATGGKS